jgi:hypothetical protein
MTSLQSDQNTRRFFSSYETTLHLLNKLKKINFIQNNKSEHDFYTLSKPLKNVVLDFSHFQTLEKENSNL